MINVHDDSKESGGFFPIFPSLSETLFITEVFASVQGESSWTGFPTTFIRLAGCPLRCSWCDTPYSFPKGTPMEVGTLLEIAQTNGLSHVCVTGGEPLMQQGVFGLMKALCDAGFFVSLETSGAIAIDRVDTRVKIILDIKCPDSQMSKKNHWPNLQRIKAQDEVKFVINSRRDYDYAKEICEREALFTHPAQILFSPVHDVLEARLLVSWILEDRLSVRLNLQVHKMIWPATTRGV